MNHLTYTPDTSGLKKLVEQAVANLGTPSREPLASGFRQAASLYLGFIRRRYDRASKGDGTWPDLAPSTKRARLNKTKSGKSKLKKANAKNAQLRSVLKRLGASSGEVTAQLNAKMYAGMKFSILRDTATLFNSLSLGGAMSIEQFTQDGIQVGTRVEYAKYHQAPSIPGRPPQRLIIVDPDQETQDRMTKAINDAIIKALNGK